MNSKVIVAVLVVLAFVAGGYFLFYGNKTSVMNTQPTSTNNSGDNTQTQGQNTIILTQSGFSPSTLTVKVGTAVTWVNKSGSEAAVYSNPHPIHTNYPPLNLGTFADGGTLSLTFNKIGTYGYHNHLNPSQTGTIIVQ